MTLRLPPWLDPFSGRLRYDDFVLRAFRLALVLCLVLIPVYGVFMEAGGHVDPWPVRAVWFALSAALLTATFRSSSVRAAAPAWMTAYLGGIVLWVGAVVMANGLSGGSAVGYMFTYAAAGGLVSFACERPPLLAAFLGAGAAVGAAAAAVIPSPETDPALFVLSVTSLGGVLFIQTYARLRERAGRAETEITLAEAERLSQVGSWSYDAETGHRWWSAGMYRLVGLSPSAAEPELMVDFVPEPERSELEELERQILAGEVLEVDRTFGLRRADGVLRSIRSIVRVTRSPEGRASRLVGVSMDVTAQVEHAQTLERARCEAEAAAALKSSILANMSHEIRTPLTAVIGFARLLRDELGGEHDDLVEPIESGGERLLETLNSVLDFARIEAGEVEITPEPVDLAAEARALLPVFGAQAQAKGLRLTVSEPESPVWASGARAEIGRAMTNLVSNAIKFTREGGVTVEVRAEAGGAAVVVADTGQGIAREFLPDLFEPFRQESIGNGRRHEGSGLGLAITHRLVRAMGGTIEVESELGEGTAFTIRLPLAKAPAPPALDSPAPEASGAAVWVTRAAGASRGASRSARTAPVVAPATAPSRPGA